MMSFFATSLFLLSVVAIVHHHVILVEGFVTPVPAPVNGCASLTGASTCSASIFRGATKQQVRRPNANMVIVSSMRDVKIKRRNLPVVGYSKGELDSQLVFDTWEWCANLGAPAALVAGAVLATLVEGREYMSPTRTDKPLVRTLKKLCRFLLLSSFGLEVVSIFVTTVTGTMLLSHGDRPAGSLAGVAYNSPMGFLMHNWEFEYLTARITFLQGLFNWLASVALELLIPKKGEGESARRMNRFTSSTLATIILAMVSFLNRHMTFYKNYAHMLHAYAWVCFRKFMWPLQPMTITLLPMVILNAYLGYKAFTSPPDLDDLDEEVGAGTNST